MRIVIVGLGKVGRILTKQLTVDRHDVVVIDHNPALVEDIGNIYDVLGVCGNGASYDIQQEAGVGTADLLIAATDSDEINILACLVAKKLGAKHTIARSRNPEYEKQLRLMRGELGLSMTINPEKAVSREISRVLRFPTAIKVESFSKRRIDLVEYRIAEGNPLCGIRLIDLYKSIKVKVLICAVARGYEIHIPKGDFVLEAGDHIYLTATTRDLEQFFRQLGLYKSRAKNVMIVGAGKVSYYLAQDLTETGMSVRIIDQDENRCRQISELLPKVLVIHGDGTDSELLNEEGLEEMDAFVSLTGLDETNIMLSMYASRRNVDKVIAKVNRRPFTEFIGSDSLIDCIVSTGTVTSDMILQYIRTMQNSRGSGIKTLHRMINDRVEALEFHVPADSALVGVPFRDLSLRSDLLVTGIVRKNGQIVIPGGNDMLEADDDVIVVTTDTTLQDLQDILE